MDFLVLAGSVVFACVAWILASGVWSKLALERAEHFDYHADQFFKYAACLLDTDGVKPAMVRRVLFLCEALSDKRSARRFFFLFLRPQSQDGGGMARFDREIAGLPQDFLENLLKSVLHALLAISYQNFIFGFPLRALIAALLYDRQHQKLLAGRIYSGTDHAMKSSSLAFNH